MNQPEALRLAELCRTGALINDEWDKVADELTRLSTLEARTTSVVPVGTVSNMEASADGKVWQYVLVEKRQPVGTKLCLCASDAEHRLKVAYDAVMNEDPGKVVNLRALGTWLGGHDVYESALLDDAPTLLVPMTGDEIDAEFHTQAVPLHPPDAFFAGARSAERHHEIGIEPQPEQRHE